MYIHEWHNFNQAMARKGQGVLVNQRRSTAPPRRVVRAAPCAPVTSNLTKIYRDRGFQTSETRPVTSPQSDEGRSLIRTQAHMNYEQVKYSIGRRARGLAGCPGEPICICHADGLRGEQRSTRLPVVRPAVCCRRWPLSSCHVH